MKILLVVSMIITIPYAHSSYFLNNKIERDLSHIDAMLFKSNVISNTLTIEYEYKHNDSIYSHIKTKDGKVHTKQHTADELANQGIYDKNNPMHNYFNMLHLGERLTLYAKSRDPQELNAIFSDIDSKNISVDALTLAPLHPISDTDPQSIISVISAHGTMPENNRHLTRPIFMPILQFAINNSLYELETFLFSKNANINAVNSYSENAVTFAILKGRPMLLNNLIRMGVEFKINRYEFYPIATAIYNYSAPRAAAVLLFLLPFVNLEKGCSIHKVEIEKSITGNVYRNRISMHYNALSLTNKVLNIISTTKFGMDLESSVEDFSVITKKMRKLLYQDYKKLRFDNVEIRKSAVTKKINWAS